GSPDPDKRVVIFGFGRHSPENRCRQTRGGRFARAMGFFDRFSAKKPEPSAPLAPVNGHSHHSQIPDRVVESSPTPVAQGTIAGGVKAHLAAAREKIEAKDLPGAMAIYEELLAVSGDRADVLVAISGDLGSCGHVAEIIELIAPRYAAD